MNISKNKGYEGLSEESELYYSKAEAYKEFSAAEDYKGKIVEFLVPRIKDKVVIDLCCGNGKYAKLLSTYTKKYIGIDKSLAQINIANSRKYDGNVVFIQDSVESISLKKETADVIISTWGLGTVQGDERKQNAISESIRLLKPQGVIYLIENDTKDEFQSIRGEDYSERTRTYNEWLVKNGFTRITNVQTDFEFKSVEEARNIFLAIWGEKIASDIKKKKITHNVVIFKLEKKEKIKDVLERVKETASQVVRKSEHVHIDPTSLSNFANNLVKQDFVHWIEQAPYNLRSLSTKERLQLLVLFNAVSFSYWGNPKWTIEYKGEKYDGSWAMLISFIRAYKNGKPIFDSVYLSSLSLDEWRDITKGNVEIPLLEERLNNLREVGQALAKRYDGNFENLLIKANYDAVKIINILASEFPCFTDVAEYNGRTVYFFKRAQALIEDIHRWFKGKEIEKIKNVQNLTACADYKLPQILREKGILEYSQNLAIKIDNDQELVSGSKEEIEIRANTILAVDLILNELRKRMPNLLAADINDYLWLESQRKVNGRKPYHKVRTTAY